MEGFLEVFFFSVLLTSGTSLKCETCIDVGQGCSGSQMICPAGFDNCSVALVETSAGSVRTVVTVKGCASSNSCKNGPFYASFGQAKVRGSVVCCPEFACALASPQLPPINTTFNGKQCPACYTFTSSCVTEVEYCTGSEDYCIDALTHVNYGPIDMKTTMKGCVSEKICVGLKDNATTLGRVTEGHCYAASSGSPASGPILLLLPGLLAMKVFF